MFQVDLELDLSNYFIEYISLMKNTNTTNKENYFIVTDKDITSYEIKGKIHSYYVIWGLGKTEELAWENASNTVVNKNLTWLKTVAECTKLGKERLDNIVNHNKRPDLIKALNEE